MVESVPNISVGMFRKCWLCVWLKRKKKSKLNIYLLKFQYLMGRCKISF